MLRYVNASDVSKLLGKPYGVFWSKHEENINIILGKRERYKPKPQTFELNAKTVEVIQALPKKEVKALVQITHTKEQLSKAYKEYKPESCEETDSDDEDYVPQKEKMKEIVHKQLVIETLNKVKKETVQAPTHVEYVAKTSAVLKQVSVPVLKTVLDHDFTMERGNVEEERIIEQYGIHKDNKFRSVEFKVEGQKYKVGCRFDGVNVEIKTRKESFKGVPLYEKVQIHFYMAASGSKEWTLKEKYADEVRDHRVVFDEPFFEKMKTDLHESWEKLSSYDS